LGLIATAAFLTLSIVSGWSDFAAWGLVAVAFVIIAIAYAIVNYTPGDADVRRAQRGGTIEER